MIAPAGYHPPFSLLKFYFCAEQVRGPTWDAALCNLARACHKQHKYEEALQAYQQALALAPKSAATYAGLAYVYHTMGRFSEAIDHYHRALGLNAADTFCEQMLQKALEDELGRDLSDVFSVSQNTTLGDQTFVSESGGDLSFADTSVMSVV